MSWDKFENKLERGPSGATRAIGWQIFIAVLVILAIIAAVTVLVRPFQVIDRVANPDKIVYNYEYFYNQAEARTAIQRKIDEAKGAVTRFEDSAGDRKDWTFEDKTEHSRLSSLVDGLNFQCADIVADYNAKAQQVSRNIFKTDSTPYRLSECE